MLIIMILLQSMKLTMLLFEDKEIINTYISADENYEKVFDDETFSIYIKK